MVVWPYGFWPYHFWDLCIRLKGEPSGVSGMCYWAFDSSVWTFLLRIYRFAVTTNAKPIQIFRKLTTLTSIVFSYLSHYLPAGILVVLRWFHPSRLTRLYWCDHQISRFGRVSFEWLRNQTYPVLHQGHFLSPPGTNELYWCRIRLVGEKVMVYSLFLATISDAQSLYEYATLSTCTDSRVSWWLPRVSLVVSRILTSAEVQTSCHTSLHLPKFGTMPVCEFSFQCLDLMG
jgi:hypothetical protein